ncbi:hypothetical protein [Cellulomonas timonensis]|nr:hypothetical protein [Cellulomonas timonensis]
MVLAVCSVIAGLVPYLLREPASADAGPRLTRRSQLLTSASA